MDGWKIDLPTAVKVGYQRYRIDLMSEEERRNSGGKLGSCDHLRSVIKLSDHLAGPEAVNTLLHEVMHAIWWVWSIGEETAEERGVTNITNGLCCVIADNPDFCKWLSRNLNSKDSK